MKFIAIVSVILAVLCPATAQQPQALATAAGRSFYSSDLPADAQRIYENSEQFIKKERERLLSDMINDAVLELEAKELKVTVAHVIQAEQKKVPVPTDAEVKSVYDANAAALGNRPFEEVKKQIAEYMHEQAAQKVIAAFIDGLRTKHKVAPGKNVNAFGLKSNEVLATIGGEAITLQEFENKNKIALWDARVDIYEHLRGELETIVLSGLIAEEAKARKIEAGELIAAEVTNKLRDFTDEERLALETGLRDRLFAKYQAAILLKEPTPVVLNISADDDPSFGNSAAPVTVVMFTDLQCPACARTHPVLKKVLSEYGDNVRLVVRDFPLETIHPNAFEAAAAANAANAQGKFVEFAELLYRNQQALDRASLLKYAADLGLNVKQFELDFSGEKAAAEVRKDIADGKSYGIHSTPTIYVNGVKVHRLSADGIRRSIDRALK
jgi:protein-disulfide isomerase